MRIETRLLAFLRELIAHGPAVRVNGQVLLPNGRPLPRELLAIAVRAGAVAIDGEECRATPVTAQFLHDLTHSHDRAHSDRAAAPPCSSSESPLTRLVAADPGFLADHHVVAGERLRRLVERAQMLPRLTATYADRSVRARGKGMSGAELSDFALDARQALAALHRQIPADCLGVALDVCGYLRGLQEVEAARGLPRRSGKIVLRIGLDHLAMIWGLTPRPAATGPARSWRDTPRPPLTP